VAAQVGQSLQAGDILVVLEAMKMETNITAPSTGKISSMRVNQGDSVQAGQIVAEFE
jgi:methylmalonyl-CoA carboxyltransferase small subunit